MTEHEQFIEIMDLIGYELNKYKYKIQTTENYTVFKIVKTIGDTGIDVREIIFTQEFMNKLSQYLNWNSNSKLEKLGGMIVYHLDKPVEYLYKLIK